MHFARIPFPIPHEAMLAEIKLEHWEADTRRQTMITVQRETRMIGLVTARQSAAHPTIEPSLEPTPMISFYPNAIQFLLAFGRRFGGVLGMAMYVSLPPHHQVYPHIDTGRYYDRRDRFHLVLQGQYDAIIGGEHTRFEAPNLYWFNNHVVHSTVSTGDVERIALIFDVLDSRWREMLTP